MNITTTVNDYLGAYNSTYDWTGKSFVVKAQSGYYFPCDYAFVDYINDRAKINFIKGSYFDYYPNILSGEKCTQVDVLTEEANCTVLDTYNYPTRPYDGIWSQEVPE